MTTLKRIRDRVHIEKNETLQSQGVNEYGDPGKVEKRFWENKDCQSSFSAYMCYINFPRCDWKDDSLPTCTTACENYHTACRVFFLLFIMCLYLIFDI